MADVEPPRDEELEGFRHPATLENRTPNSVMMMYTNVIQFVQQYGWFLLFGVILAFFIKRKLQQYLAQQPRSQSSPQDLHRYDSETALKRQEAFESSRRRLQEKLDADAAKFAEEQKKKEEEKRKQKIADWENHLQGKGYRSKYRPPEESGSSSCTTSSSATGTSSSQKRKPKYRPTDYNPLTGGGGGGGGGVGGYRPAARRGGGG